MSAPGGTGSRGGPKALARGAGVLYLLVAVSTVFAGVVNTHLLEPGDAAATADALRASAALSRVALVSELLGAVCFLLTSMVLHRLLRRTDRAAAAAMVVFVAVSVAMQCLNLVHRSAALTVATGRGHSGAPGPVGPDEQALLFAGMYQDGFLLSQTFFGLWLIPLGYLVARSGLFPKALGVLLVIGCAGHLTDVLTRLAAPGIGEAVSPFAMVPAAVAEISFIVWLLVKGARHREPEAPAADTAAPAERPSVPEP
ncbi:DUF4386 domain-containing protein [Nocardiopsis halophila]|uniref:DUF4386 domain-containing protein n=1 Tax=Nocardiopsis halophila TaxID=141692 RepID=UPI00035D80D3|nr:DUF4386 domain-containing protein [Nocardiopsis halophila]